MDCFRQEVDSQVVVGKPFIFIYNSFIVPCPEIMDFEENLSS